eukprot:TRINITY_DN7788_c0_g1_i1.p5 TRINITY_DN7788_c0_g1~~TRINITY_DN7788_c0_g1_i1.p5  ORF type:complete len:106 (+),score=2.54 TRINITY_DN7788_c0_g1_i1:751-1068(+)
MINNSLDPIYIHVYKSLNCQNSSKKRSFQSYNYKQLSKLSQKIRKKSTYIFSMRNATVEALTPREQPYIFKELAADKIVNIHNKFLTFFTKLMDTVAKQLNKNKT